MNQTVKVTCINNSFADKSKRKLPELLENYTINYQVVEDGVLFVELKEFRGLLFEMEKHFFVVYDSEIDKVTF